MKDNVSFLKVKVKAPENLTNPLLAKKVDNTTVYGVGTWTGWYYSEELFNAIKFGYEILEIYEGYIFKSEFVFDKFVDTMYEMKVSSAKNSPKYMISKLLQNSLFGKVSMKRLLLNHTVIDMDKLQEFYTNFDVESTLNVGNKVLVSYYPLYPNDLNINIAIGAAITANARIYMSQFLNNDSYKVFYMDTDCVVIDKPLEDHLVNEKALGLMKLENTFSKFVSIGPKFYGGLTVDGTEIVKSKGLKTKISLDQLELCLNDNIIQNIYQDKWFRSLVDANIIIENVNYKIRPTNVKRQLNYNNGRLISTSNLDVSD